MVKKINDFEFNHYHGLCVAPRNQSLYICDDKYLIHSYH